MHITSLEDCVDLTWMVLRIQIPILDCDDLMRLPFDSTFYCTYVVSLVLEPCVILENGDTDDDFYGLSEDGGADNYDYHSTFREHDDKYAAYTPAKDPSEISRCR